MKRLLPHIFVPPFPDEWINPYLFTAPRIFHAISYGRTEIGYRFNPGAGSRECERYAGSRYLRIEPSGARDVQI
jgi:hypothetical protein